MYIKTQYFVIIMRIYLIEQTELLELIVIQ